MEPTHKHINYVIIYIYKDTFCQRFLKQCVYVQS